ncbi:MAG: KEOPS complex subunit Cgi121 [Methanotrichaceae archaeon]|nr:KEOPS complex subunit Cgi121 [Methanotrichaceae archaeon]
MKNILLLFGRPAIQDREHFLLALKNLQSRTGCVVQVLDADKVVSEKHLFFAAEKALLAFSEDKNVANDLGVEILRYASGERQIEKALSIGFSDSTRRIALIVMKNPEIESSWPDTSALSKVIHVDGLGCSFKADEVMVAFHITHEELEAADKAKLPDLVLERVALVETFR